MGHLCFIASLFFSVVFVPSVLINIAKQAAQIPEANATLSLEEEYISAQNAQGRSRCDAMEFFRGRNRRHRRDARVTPRARTRQDFDDTPNQVVGVRLGNLHARDVPGFRDLPARQLNVREVQLPIDLRSHAFEPRFPYERILFRGAFDQRRESAILCCARLGP